MTQRQATIEAKKRWGWYGRASEMLGPISNKFEVGLYIDGLTGGVSEIKGVGATWEAAFGEATRREEVQV
jgi:hypothetical protein